MHHLTRVFKHKSTMTTTQHDFDSLTTAAVSVIIVEMPINTLKYYLTYYYYI